MIYILGEIKHEVGINEFSDMPEELFAEMMTYDMSSHVDVNATGRDLQYIP